MNPFTRESWLNLNAGSKRALEALLRSPAAAKALDDVERADLAAREELVSRLAALPGQHEQACIEAARANERARAAVKLAEEKLKTAIAEEAATFSHSISCSLAASNAISEVTRKLENSADPRLLSFAKQLGDIFMGLRHESFPAKNMKAAHLALQIARDRAMDMRLQALSKADVTAELRELADHTLRPALAAVKRGPPRVLDSCILEPGGTTAHEAMAGELEPLMH